MITSGIDPLFTGIAYVVLHGAKVVTKYFEGNGTSPLKKNGDENINQLKTNIPIGMNARIFEKICIICGRFEVPIVLRKLRTC